MPMVLIKKHYILTFAQFSLFISFIVFSVLEFVSVYILFISIFFVGIITGL